MFIAIEGGDGVGKTTQVERAAEYLKRRGRDAIIAREPGGTPVGERVREIFLDPKLRGMDVWTELFLCMAARTQITREVILPALQVGKDVVTDRYLLSSVVYQGAAGGIGCAVVEEMGASATGGLQPDLTVVLDLDVEEALSRRGGEADRMEEKAIEFHRRVRDGYRQAAAGRPTVKVISAEGTVDEVEARIRREIDGVLG
jgi:dTMP kinase